MKTILNKINLPAILALVLGLGLMSGSLAQQSAFAGRTDVIPAIQVTVPNSFAGQYLHVLYVVGRPGFLNVNNPIPYVDITRSQSTSQVVTSNTINFPPVEIDKSLTPGRPGYNMVIFALSKFADIQWVNSDINANPTQYQFLQVVQKPVIDALVSQQGAAAVLKINLN
jgi:hypothetical protein